MSVKKSLLALASLCMLSQSLFAQPTVLVTGGVRGLGKAITSQYLEQGWKVYATTRHKDSVDMALQNDPNLTIIEFDLQNHAEIDKLVKHVIRDAGQLDVLVNNAVYAVLGAEEAVSLVQAKDQFDVNFFAPFKLIQAVLPHMRENNKGHIINISSTSGMRAVPGLGVYAAAKFALEGLSESLAAELAPWHIKVTLVQPGSVQNNWGKNAKDAERQLNVARYDSLRNNLRTKLNKLALTAQPMSEIGQLVVGISMQPTVPLRVQTGEQAKGVANAILVDPTGNDIVEKMTTFADSLYKG